MCFAGLMAAVVTLDLLRHGRAAPQAGCKLICSLAAQLLLIITCGSVQMPEHLSGVVQVGWQL